MNRLEIKESAQLRQAFRKVVTEVVVANFKARPVVSASTLDPFPVVSALLDLGGYAVAGILICHYTAVLVFMGVFGSLFRHKVHIEATQTNLAQTSI